MVRESTFDETWKAIRRGNIGLDETGDDIDRGTLGREYQVDTGSARLSAPERAISSSIFLPTTIIRSASSSTMTTICGSGVEENSVLPLLRHLRQRVKQRRPFFSASRTLRLYPAMLRTPGRT